MSKIYVNTIYPNTGGVVSVSGSLLLSGSGTHSLEVIGDISASGNITANQYHVQQITSSIIFKDGPTQFGNDATDRHSFSGSLFAPSASLGDVSITPFHPLQVKGNISASNKIYGHDVYAEDYFHSNNHFIVGENNDGDQQFGLGSFDNIYFGKSHVFTGSGDFPGHITSSGNISSSGDLIANNLILEGDGVLQPSLKIKDITNDYFLSISQSNAISRFQVLTQYQDIQFLSNPYSNDANGQGHIFLDGGQGTTKFHNEKVIIDANGAITASGNISASGLQVLNVTSSGEISASGRLSGTDLFLHAGSFDIETNNEYIMNPSSGAGTLTFGVGGSPQSVEATDTLVLKSTDKIIQLGQPGSQTNVTASHHLQVIGSGSFAYVSASGGIQANHFLIPKYSVNLGSGQGSVGEIVLAEGHSVTGSRRVFLRNQITTDSTANGDYGLTLGDSTYGFYVSSPFWFQQDVTGSKFKVTEVTASGTVHSLTASAGRVEGNVFGPENKAGAFHNDLIIEANKINVYGTPAKHTQLRLDAGYEFYSSSINFRQYTNITSDETITSEWIIGADNENSFRINNGPSFLDDDGSVNGIYITGSSENANVGIGTSDPEFKLDVSGDVRAHIVSGGFFHMSSSGATSSIAGPLGIGIRRLENVHTLVDIQATNQSDQDIFDVRARRNNESSRGWAIRQAFHRTEFHISQTGSGEYIHDDGDFYILNKWAPNPGDSAVFAVDGGNGTVCIAKKALELHQSGSVTASADVHVIGTVTSSAVSSSEYHIGHTKLYAGSSDSSDYFGPSASLSISGVDMLTIHSGSTTFIENTAIDMSGSVHIHGNVTASSIAVRTIRDMTGANTVDLASANHITTEGRKFIGCVKLETDCADGAFFQFEVRNTNIERDSIIIANAVPDFGGITTGLDSSERKRAAAMSGSIIRCAPRRNTIGFTISENYFATASVTVYNETGIIWPADGDMTASFMVL